MSNTIPFELLQKIVGALGDSNAPLQVKGELYRPIVFQANATRHYVFCLVPIHIGPTDFFEGVSEAYDAYLDGRDSAYLFFRDMSSEGLKTQVVDWYKHLAA